MDENKKNDICDDSAKESRTASENNSDDSENGSTLKIILLVLSLLLWGYAIFIGLRNGISTSVRREVLDLYSFVHPIGDIWFDAIGRNVLLAFLLIVFAAYPIYYFIDKRSKKIAAKEKLKSETKETDNPLNDEDSTDRSKSEDNETELIDERKRKKRFIWFALSFIPYLYILWTGIFGIDFWGDKYGFPAMIIVAGLFSLVPVYPVLLVFQIMFYIFSVRSGKFGEKQKRGTGRIVLVLICAALVIGIGASILQYDANSYQRNYKDDAERQKDKEIIEQYLAEEYGEYAEDMEIVESDYNPDSYIIKTSLLENGSFDVSIEDGVVYDGLYDNGRYGFKYEFKEKNSLDEVLGDYLLDTYLNIDNCDMNPHLYDYDFRKFLDGDIKGFAESCEFNVLFVHVYEDKYDREKLVEVAKELCDGFCSDLPRYSDHSIPKVRFIIDGERAFDTIIINTDYEIIMHVMKYGSSLEYEEVHYIYATNEITVTPRNSD